MKTTYTLLVVPVKRQIKKGDFIRYSFGDTFFYQFVKRVRLGEWKNDNGHWISNKDACPVKVVIISNEEVNGGKFVDLNTLTFHTYKGIGVHVRDTKGGIHIDEKCKPIIGKVPHNILEDLISTGKKDGDKVQVEFEHPISDEFVDMAIKETAGKPYDYSTVSVEDKSKLVVKTRNGIVICI